MYIFLVFLFFNFFFSRTHSEIDENKKPTLSNEEIIFQSTAVFAEVVSITESKHYKPIDFENAMNKGIKAFVSSFDPHSSFLDKESYKEILDSISGTFFGVGIVIDNTRKEKDKALIVVDVVEDGPAERAGILANDKIVEVDGKSLEGLSTEKIIHMIKGEKDTKVILKILRENKPDLLTFTITRDTVKEQQSLCLLLKDLDIYYLSLTVFSEIAIHQMEHLLKKIAQGNAKGLILDLRNNSGGLLGSVLDIAGLFVPKNSPVVITKDNTNRTTATYKTERDPIATNLNVPLIILINNYTASAAEILAGILKFYIPSLVIMGEKTFGKGSVQEVIPISNNCALKLTTSLYFLPDDSTPQGSGITPDITVKRTMPETEQSKWLVKHFGREENFSNSIRATSSKISDSAKTSTDKPSDQKEYSDDKKNNKSEKITDKKSKTQEKIEKMMEDDNQLQEALCFIQIVNLLPKIVPMSNIIKAFQPIQSDMVEEIK